MSENTSNQERLQKFRSQIIESRVFGWLANLPPIAWITRLVVRILVKDKIGSAPVEKAVIKRAVETDLQATLKGIVRDVVDALGYVGAMVATYEQGDSLPVRAFYVDPKITSEEKLKEWEEQISKIRGKRVIITDPNDPDIATAYRYREEFKHNLSVRAIEAEEPIVSGELFDLFTPVAPLSSKPLIKGIQQILGIQQVIAIPFFLVTKEVVGNLFIAKSGVVSDQDRLILAAFGRQAAAAIESERRNTQVQITQKLVSAIQTSLQNEANILQLIAKGVVDDLNFVGAIVATYEANDSLPVRAFYIDPKIASEERIKEWEKQISEFQGKPVSITDPNIAVAYRNREEFKHNLSVRAIEAEEPIVSGELFDLFTPIAPESSKQVVKGIQEILGIQQVIAVPFFLITTSGNDQSLKKEVVGNLFAATRSKAFSSGELELLEAFGQQAAIGIRNSQLYEQAQTRRVDAEKLALTATLITNIRHDLKSELGKIRFYAEEAHSLLTQLSPQEPKQEPILKYLNKILSKAEMASDLVKRLKQPTQPIEFIVADVNKRITAAIATIEFPETKQIELVQDLSDDLLNVRATDDLTEVFRVLLNNAVDAIVKAGTITILSQLVDGKWVEVTVNDTGPGVPEDLREKIFEEGITTKGSSGLGYGLHYATTVLRWMDGEICLAEQNSANAGATFVVRLPLVTIGTK